TVSDASHRHEQGNEAAFADAADDLPPVIKDARNAIEAQAFDIIERCASAFRREQLREGLADESAAVVSEQRFGAPIERQHASVALDDDDAVGRGVEN